MRKLLDLFYEQNVKDKLSFNDFIRFLRTEENQQSTELYTSILGRNASKNKKVDTKVLIIMVINSIPTI